MFDLHNHILPGLDDGAKTIEESLALLRMAEEQGISHILATPHLHPGRYDNTPQDILLSLQYLQEQLQHAGLIIRIAAAAEIRIGPELPVMLSKQQLPFMGYYQQKKVLLLELPHSHIPPGTEKLLHWLATQQILPLIAHPERNRELQAEPARISLLRSAGCLFQLTAASLTGEMGEKPQQLAKEWIKNKVFHIVASDAHSCLRRPPRMAEARKLITELTDAVYAEQLCHHNPARLASSVFTQGMLLC